MAALHQLLLQPPTKTNLQVFLKSPFCNHQLIPHKNKIASASIAITEMVLVAVL